MNEIHRGSARWEVAKSWCPIAAPQATSALVFLILFQARIAATALVHGMAVAMFWATSNWSVWLMHSSKTHAWAQALVHAIEHANIAHSEHGKSPDDSVRFHDRVTPYAVHPIWCAASLLQEPAVSAHLREVGSIALLWHDTLEDTTLPLPPGTTEEVKRLVEGMSFESFDEERDELWSRSKEIKLLKLYDKVSNLLDGAWMKPEKWNVYVEHTKRLAVDVELAFGLLGIVKIARAIAVAR